MRVLVTGASGFLGEHLYKAMRLAGHEMRYLARQTSDVSRIAGLPGTRNIGDITDRASLDRAVDQCDCVVHAAADLNYWRRDPGLQRRINVDGTRNVAQAARLSGVRSFIHVSSTGAVGIPDGPYPVDETFRFNLDDSGLAYHVSKQAAEQVIREEVAEGLPAIIVCPGSITGPKRIAQLVHSVRRSLIVPCFSGGNCVVHVDDVVNGVLAALHWGKPGERYILGGDNLTFVEMARQAANLMGLTRRFVRIPPTLTGAAACVSEPWARWRGSAPKFAYMIHFCANRYMYYDSSKAKKELNYQPQSFPAILEHSIPLEFLSPAAQQKACGVPVQS